MARVSCGGRIIILVERGPSSDHHYGLSSLRPPPPINPTGDVRSFLVREKKTTVFRRRGLDHLIFTMPPSEEMTTAGGGDDDCDGDGDGEVVAAASTGCPDGATMDGGGGVVGGGATTR